MIQGPLRQSEDVALKSPGAEGKVGLEGRLQEVGVQR